MDLDSFEACGFGAYVSWIVGDEVAAGGDSCSILLFFFGTDGADGSGVGYGAAFRDAVLVDEEDGIGSFEFNRTASRLREMQSEVWGT